MARPPNLLPKSALIKTGPVDFATWNYYPLLGYIQKLRFKLAKNLIPQETNALLEIGYGSGVFLPELAQHAAELYGVDIHTKAGEVSQALANLGMKANLFTAPAESLPFSDHKFDTVVAVSSLEFVSNLDHVCREVRRVLKAEGSFVVITPGHSKLVDFGLKLLTGRSAEKDFAGRRSNLVPTLQRHFDTERKIAFPPINQTLVTLYDAFRLVPARGH